jgi:dUTP pyrophosphatase
MSKETLTIDQVEEIYHSIQLPKRATKGSAGYDFYSPIDFELKPRQTITIAIQAKRA